MTRIPIVSPEKARGLKKFIFWSIKRQQGYIPGIIKIALVDLKVGNPLNRLYKYLHLRKRSPLTRLQREMLATVVNGIVGGAP